MGNGIPPVEARRLVFLRNAAGVFGVLGVSFRFGVSTGLLRYGFQPEERMFVEPGEAMLWK